MRLDRAEGREQQSHRPVQIVPDLQARHGRKVDTLPPDILEEVMARLVPIFE
ncbi:hypothetical protein IMCC9480_2992 [Oxalobacteraceae bacterium IMCC9480]|nr:hypothetical protein IMCC9480_2992 [Oxalobacteraceae bacterium IMCC9480]